MTHRCRFHRFDSVNDVDINVVLGATKSKSDQSSDDDMDVSLLARLVAVAIGSSESIFDTPEELARLDCLPPIIIYAKELRLCGMYLQTVKTMQP